MTNAFLIQTAVSGIAIALMVALAAWARIARPTPPLDEARARTLLAEDFPNAAVEAVWIAEDGAGAIAKSAASALVLVRIGDSYAARRIGWAAAVSAITREGWVALPLGDASAPSARLRLSAWPPVGAAA